MKLWTIAEMREVGVTLFETRRGLLTLEQVIEWLDLGEIVKTFNTWAVTSHGVECMVEFYPIEIARLSDPHWADQLSNKRWMTAAMLRDFTHALEFARTHFDQNKRANPTAPSVRFAVLKRDNYRCQLCGRSAQDHGVVLEVDHKMPLAKDGKTTMTNLWTLCFDCNRGKRDNSL